MKRERSKSGCSPEKRDATYVAWEARVWTKRCSPSGRLGDLLQISEGQVLRVSARQQEVRQSQGY